jgi:hypothetical protein
MTKHQDKMLKCCLLEKLLFFIFRVLVELMSVFSLW